MAHNRVIGINGQMPWHLSADLKRFKQITMGSPIIMGRKTFEAIGIPLPSRTNIIITRNSDYQQPGCLVFGDIDSALRHCSESPEVFIIGGATLYEALLPRADYLYLTEIDKDFAGDTFFPAIDVRQWREIDSVHITDDPSVDFSYHFLIFEHLKGPLPKS